MPGGCAWEASQLTRGTAAAGGADRKIRIGILRVPTFKNARSAARSRARKERNCHPVCLLPACQAAQRAPCGRSQLSMPHTGFAVPSRAIRGVAHMAAFKASASHAELMSFLRELCASVQGAPRRARDYRFHPRGSESSPCARLGSRDAERGACAGVSVSRAPEPSAAVQAVLTALDTLHDSVDAHPPEVRPLRQVPAPARATRPSPRPAAAASRENDSAWRARCAENRAALRQQDLPSVARRGSRRQVR